MRVQWWLFSAAAPSRAAVARQIRAFLELVSGGADPVAVPLTPNWKRRSASDPAYMEIENWTVVQAFGLADLGKGGFFTMKHRVVDATPSLQRLWSHCDSSTLAWMCRESVDALYHHWATFLGVLDSRPASRRVKASGARRAC